MSDETASTEIMSKVQPFAEILASYKRQFMPPGSGGELAEYFLNQAYSINYWTVHDALRDMLTSTACLVGTTQMGIYYARYGVARRLRDVFFGFRNIYAVTPPDRTEPLETDETSSVSRDLNMIYINLIGITDNLAWFLLIEENPESVTNLPKTEIGLFKKAIFKNSRFQSLKDSGLLEAQAWWKNVLKNRDPSAHRIPLTVAPSIVSADEAKQYLDLQQVSNKALNRGEFDESRRAMKAMEKIGKFVPIFLHDPNEGHVELYPTIAEDIRHMLTLTEKCLNFWRTQILPEKSL